MKESLSAENPLRGFITRHSKKAKPGEGDERYPSLKLEGVALAEERAQEIKKVIDQSPENAVILLAGASDQPRTKETEEIYGAELEKIVSGGKEADPLLEVVTRKDIMDAETGSFHGSLERIEKILQANPDKKIVVDFPMQIRGFSMNYKEKDRQGTFGDQRWLDQETGKHSKFVLKLMEDVHDNNDEATRTWIKAWGEYQGMSCPKPIEVARQYLEGFTRLQEFAAKRTDRPLVIGGVGHSWDLDAFATWLALGCPEDVDKETFYSKYMEISQGGEMIKETELIQFEVSGDQLTLKYRDREYSTKKDKQEL